MSIAANLARVKTEIADACARAGRSKGDVALMAVSKMHPAAVIAEAYAAGVRLFGENKVQEFQAKRLTLVALPKADFHLIGHLQSNKTIKAAEIFDAVDSVDSLKIAERLNAAAAALSKDAPRSDRGQALERGVEARHRAGCGERDPARCRFPACAGTARIDDRAAVL